MRVFQTTYHDRSGQTQTAGKWYIEFTDHKETVRRVPGFTNRRQTEKLGERIDDLVALKGAGATLSLEMSKWLEDMSPRLCKCLARYGLLDTAKVASLRPLAEHLNGATDAPGWKQHLQSKGNTAAHVTKSCGMVRRIFEGCKFAYWSDISASRIMAYLAGLRTDKADDNGNVKRGLSAQTFNYHLMAFKSFCKWMVSDGRASVSPVAYLTGLNAKADRRKVRRALAVEEIRWLLDVTRRGPNRYGMSGTERAMLYRLALETGLRSNELRTLTRSSFALDGDKPTVVVEAAYSKHRREDVLPLRTDTAADLRNSMAVKLPGARAFNMPTDRHDSAEMFRQDLDGARLAWLDDASSPQERQARERSSFLLSPDGAGRVVDFHGLRHTCGSLLAAAQVHPKVAQAIMRHCDINLTMSRYTHVYAGQEVDAVAALPDLDCVPAKQSARATGTDNAKAAQDAVGNLASDRTSARQHIQEASAKADSVLAVCLAQTVGFHHNSLDSVSAAASEGRSGEIPCNMRESSIESVPQLCYAGVAELADAQDSKS